MRAKEGKLAAFFEPAGYGVARDPESAREAPETGAFLVSAKYLLAPLWRIGVRSRVLTALPVAIVAEVLLLAIWSLAVLDDIFAATVIAGDELSNHYAVISFDLEPLPTNLDALAVNGICLPCLYP